MIWILLTILTITLGLYLYKDQIIKWIKYNKKKFLSILTSISMVIGGGVYYYNIIDGGYNPRNSPSGDISFSQFTELWNITDDFDSSDHTYTVRFVDADSDGNKDEIAVSHYTNITIYNSDGTVDKYLDTANYNIDYSTWVSKTKHHKVGLVIGGENIMNHLIDYINKYNVIRNNLIDILTKDSDNSKSYLIDLYLKKKYTLAYDIGLLTEYKNLSNRELIDIVVRSNIQEMVLHQLLDGLIQNGNLTRKELMDILSFEMNKQRGTISDIFIGKLMFHWFINECDDWNEGDYSLNTSCDDGRLIVNV